MKCCVKLNTGFQEPVVGNAKSQKIFKDSQDFEFESLSLATHENSVFVEMVLFCSVLLCFGGGVGHADPSVNMLIVPGEHLP